MTEQSHKPQERRSPFRRVALQRIDQPFENDTPELLVRWRPGLILAAAGLLGAALLLWLFP